ncbi:E3 ubiquitin/ISG15 ligase TRIM25-like [Astyanax mexicanus]|uniref:E3 ubiquitin/ISG15 ligase TRIM25-like n=1 Tax=Astyanax mexicanus TaxID=7994 RepID=A0A8T2LIE7_ASTMX|nr:E3 ubiquitin/ISG15 ligase TRIM25-like [Astyanax mexicanus]
MAEAALKTLDTLSCPICLDLLKDPVTIPCGHSYCLGCIKDCWGQDDQKGVYSCPQCRHIFSPRPVLNKNTMLAELAESQRKKRLQAAPAAAVSAAAVSPVGSGGVECDICTGTKQTAVKSCLVCLLSFCEAHIQPHYESPGYKKHKLVEASVNLQEKLCCRHDKLLEVFCRSDQQCICLLCVMDEHSGHKTVSAAAERDEKQKQLMEAQRESQLRIQQTEKKLQDLRGAMETLRRSAQAAVADNEKIFTELIQSIERRRSEMNELIRAQEKVELSLAEELQKKLEQEIADLRRRDSELKKLLDTEDPINFLQCFQSLSSPPQSAGIPQFPISPLFSLEKLKKAVTEVMEQVEPKLVTFSGGFISSSLTAPSQRVPPGYFHLSQTRDDFLKYACQLTLDPNTANPQLALSGRNKIVTVMHLPRPYPRHPERFDRVQQVLCRESLFGRCYWEAEFRTGNVNIAVSYKNINRKGEDSESGFGSNDQSWSLIHRGSRFLFKHNREETAVPVVSNSSRIGVYVDQSAGILCFYSISDTMNLLHRVHTTFTQPLYAGFGVYGYDHFVQICELKYNTDKS